MDRAKLTLHTPFAPPSTHPPPPPGQRQRHLRAHGRGADAARTQGVGQLELHPDWRTGYAPNVRIYESTNLRLYDSTNLPLNYYATGTASRPADWMCAVLRIYEYTTLILYYYTTLPLYDYSTVLVYYYTAPGLPIRRMCGKVHRDLSDGIGPIAATYAPLADCSLWNLSIYLSIYVYYCTALWPTTHFLSLRAVPHPHHHLGHFDHDPLDP
jgi:hypothetical protein